MLQNFCRNIEVVANSRNSNGLAKSIAAKTMTTVGRGTVLYCTVLYCILLYSTVLYCTLLYCRYGLEGWMEDLPTLKVGRWSHGCGSYVSGGDMVSIEMEWNL